LPSSTVALVTARPCASMLSTIWAGIPATATLAL
jgi:hypothetical protein